MGLIVPRLISIQIIPHLLTTQFKEDLRMLEPIGYPSWFSLRNLIIAKALIDMGFVYNGKPEDNEIQQEGYLETYQGWSFYSHSEEGQEIELLAVCDNALYFNHFKGLEGKTSFSVLNEAKTAIKAVVARWNREDESHLESDPAGVSEAVRPQLSATRTSVELAGVNPDLNVVPISLEATLLSIVSYQSDRFNRLKQEIVVQEQLLKFVRLDSPDYLEIKANLDEVFVQLWAFKDFG